ncbi:MAG: hypothetical protein GX988_00260 [Clostridiales bacterium]|nr:hypothetical protein [Clostridiales bacterium]
MNLKELAAEYRKSAAKLRLREQELQHQMKEGELDTDYDNESRLRMLREERYELLKTAGHLECYHSIITGEDILE